MASSQSRLVVLDTETTGTNPRRDRIVELFALEADARLDPLGSWRQRFNPGIRIPAAATRVHGIRDEDVAGQPRFAERACRVQKLVDGATLVAFNGLTFDIPLLHEELVRAGQPGLPANPRVIDPYRLFKDDCPRTRSGAVRHYLGREHASAHSAEGDVRATLDVLRVQWARRHGAAPSLQDLVHNDRDWLDVQRCFYRDSAGDVRLGFGKHRGEPAKDHLDYLGWLVRQDFNEQAKRIARSLLAKEPPC